MTFNFEESAQGSLKNKQRLDVFFFILNRLISLLPENDSGDDAVCVFFPATVTPTEKPNCPTFSWYYVNVNCCPIISLENCNPEMLLTRCVFLFIYFFITDVVQSTKKTGPPLSIFRDDVANTQDN